MIIIDIPQNTPEWDLARNGITTASMMDKIITSTGKASTSAKTYMNQLLADWYAGKSVDNWEGNKFTEIGHERESEVIDLYQFITERTIEQIGFCFKDDKRDVGCSPDGLVGDDGLFEQKNPKGSTMIKYLLDSKPPTEYRVQVQAQLWITGRSWCDFMVHHPDIGHKIWRIERDESFITIMSGMVSKFNAEMLEKRKKLEIYKNV